MIFVQTLLKLGSFFPFPPPKTTQMLTRALASVARSVRLAPATSRAVAVAGGASRLGAATRSLSAAARPGLAAGLLALGAPRAAFAASATTGAPGGAAPER